MTWVITWTFDFGDGVCIERGQPSTALKTMPHFTTYGGSYFSAGPDVYHPEFQPEGDDFMKLGDIKGEFASKAVFCPFDQPVDIITNVTGDGSDQLQLDTGSGNDHIVHDVVTNSGPGGSTFFTDNIGSTASAGCQTMPPSEVTVGYEMEAGTDLRSDNRFVFEPMDVMPSLGESIDPGLDAASGFQPHDVTAVQIGRPPDPELWLHTLG